MIPDSLQPFIRTFQVCYPDLDRILRQRVLDAWPSQPDAPDDE
jgi:hypothetical protein